MGGNKPLCPPPPCNPPELRYFKKNPCTSIYGRFVGKSMQIKRKQHAPNPMKPQVDVACSQKFSRQIFKNTTAV